MHKESALIEQPLLAACGAGRRHPATDPTRGQPPRTRVARGSGLTEGWRVAESLAASKREPEANAGPTDGAASRRRL